MHLSLLADEVVVLDESKSAVDVARAVDEVRLNLLESKLLIMCDAETNDDEFDV